MPVRHPHEDDDPHQQRHLREDVDETVGEQLVDDGDIVLDPRHDRPDTAAVDISNTESLNTSKHRRAQIVHNALTDLAHEEHLEVACKKPKHQHDEEGGAEQIQPSGSRVAEKRAPSRPTNRVGDDVDREPEHKRDRQLQEGDDQDQRHCDYRRAFIRPDLGDEASCYAAVVRSAEEIVRICRLVHGYRPLGLIGRSDELLLILELQLVQTGIVAILRDESLVCPAFDDAPIVKDEYLVGFLQTGDTLGDDERRAAGHTTRESLLKLVFSLSVDTGCRVVEDEDAGIGADCPCDCDALSLAARKRHTAFAEPSVKPVWHLANERVGLRDSSRRLNLCA